MAARRPENDEAAEGYFASISDLMVGILFIFLLMLTVFALNFADEDKDEIIRRLTIDRDAARAQLARQASEIEQLGVEIGRLRATLAAFTDREKRHNEELDAIVNRVGQIESEVSTESRRMQELRSHLLAQIKKNLREKQIEVEISEQQDVLRLPSKEIFQLGTAAFTPPGREQMLVLLEEMARLMPCYAAGPSTGCDNASPIFETVLIEGHTDTLPGENWRLSTERALAVRGLMVGPLSNLIDLRNQVGQPLLGLAGYGASRPLPQIAGNDPRNRRIEVRFLLSASREAELATLRASLGQLRKRLEALQKP